MLIIGHRGAAGIAPENTMAGLEAGFNSGADILEFDVRLTKDHIPVLHHDFHTRRTGTQTRLIQSLTLDQLQKITPEYPIATLSEVLDEFFGKIILNIECKNDAAARTSVQLIKQKYIKHESDWENIFFSSFKVSALKIIRDTSPDAQLALLQSYNPFKFKKVHKQLRLHAVGFYKRILTKNLLHAAKKQHLFTYAYTIDSKNDAAKLSKIGFDALVTNHPERVRSD